MKPQPNMPMRISLRRRGLTGLIAMLSILVMKLSNNFCYSATRSFSDVLRKL